MTKTSLYLTEAEARVKDYLENLSETTDIVQCLADCFGLDIVYDHDQLHIELDGDVFSEDDLPQLIEDAVAGATTDQIAKAYGEMNNARASVEKLPMGVSVINLYSE